MTLPNFLVIGAGRSGTTSLYHYLRQHPQIFMSGIKETNFFAYDGEEDPYAFPIRTLGAYEALFAGANRHRAVGEASPVYLTRPSVVGRIERLIPRARFIALVRDPADRAYAAYLAERRRGTERRSFDRALRDYRRGGEGPPQLAYFEPGFYHAHVTRYLARFERGRVALHLHEDFARDPLALMARVYRFLEVEDDFVPDTSVRYNATGLPQNRLLDAVVRTSTLKRNLKARMPYLLRKPVMALGTAINRRNLVKPALPREVRSELIALYRDDIVKLQDLIQRDLTPWLTVAE
jgi:hypothetical protein